MILYAISDGRGGADGGVSRWAARCFADGVDWVQIREKGLEARTLSAVAVEARRMAAGGRLLVNERADVALAAELDGVHLPSDSIGPSSCRRALGVRAVVGVSCHSLSEVARAGQDGADFVVLGPVFETASKRGYGPPLGLTALANACREAPIPVLALGGVSVENAGRCLDAGAAGVAGISLFRAGVGLSATVAALRRL